MPIARYLEVRRGYPRIGKLRKGAPKGEDGSCGPDLEWFRFTSDHPDKEAIEQVFLDKFGPEPDRIRVRLPHVTPGDSFSFWQEVWDYGGLVHRCDGNVCVQWRKEDGTYSNEPKPCPGGCTEVGRLDVIVPEMVEAGFVGPITVETHAKNDIPVIWGALQKAYEDQTDKYNGLRGIEFILYRSTESISTPPWKDDEPGKRRRRDASLVRIEPSAKWVQRQLEVFRTQAMGVLENSKVPSLSPASDDGDGVESNDSTVEGQVVNEPTNSDDFICQDCEGKIAPYATKDGMYSISKLVDLGNNLRQDPGPHCGACLKKHKEMAVNGKVKQEPLPV